jgi:hypothetical protein
VLLLDVCSISSRPKAGLVPSSCAPLALRAGGTRAGSTGPHLTRSEGRHVSLGRAEDDTGLNLRSDGIVMSPTNRSKKNKKRSLDQGSQAHGMWVASKDTLAQIMESDPACHAISVLVAAAPVCSILNILYTAAGTAAKYGPVISWTTRVVIYGCAVSFVAGCVVMSVIYSPAHSSSKRR